MAYARVKKRGKEVARPHRGTGRTWGSHGVGGSKPLVVRYGVALWDGQVQPEQIDKLYKRWAGWRLQSEKVEN